MVIGCIIVIGFAFRDILQKHTAPHYYNHLQAGAIPAIFTSIAIMIVGLNVKSVKMLWHPSLISYNLDVLSLSQILNTKSYDIYLWSALLVGIIKGIVVFTLNSGARSLDLSAVSGSAYLAFVSLAIGAGLNHIFFGEDILIFPMLITGIFAFIFYFNGPGNKIIKDGKFYTLILCISSLALLICIDYIGVASSNWFVHLSISNLTALLIFLIFIFNKKINNFTFLSNKLIILSGIVYAFMEFIFVYSFSTIGVSLAFLLGMSSYLPTMLYGSFKYGEGKWYMQSIFAIVAIFCIYLSAYKIDLVQIVLNLNLS
jgi:hypothetical protein